MRILIWDYPHYELGGRHVFVDSLIEGLGMRGHQVALASMKYHKESYCRLRHDSKQISRVELANTDALFDRRIFDELRTVVSFLKDFKPDIIHSQSFSCPSNRILDLVQTKLDLSIPQVSTTHDIYDINKLIKSLAEPESMRSLKSIVVPSLFILDRIPKLEMYAKVVLIPHGITPISINNERKESNIVFSGRLVAEKGLLDLVLAFSNIFHRLPNTQLHIFGDGPLRSYLAKLVVDLNISQRAIFHGAKSNFEVRGHLTSNSVLVQPSLIPEAFGLSVLEAMSASAGIIVSDKANLPQLIRHGVDGLVYQARDTNTLAMNLLDLANSKLLREKLGKSAQNRAFEEFSFERMIDLYENLYLQCLS